MKAVDYLKAKGRMTNNCIYFVEIVLWIIAVN